MHKNRRGNPAEKSRTKRSSSLQAQRCSQPSANPAPTTTGKIEPKKEKPGLIGIPPTKRRTRRRVKAQAADGADKFGATNAYKWVLGGVTKDDGGNEVSLKAFGGYFDNLAAATTNEKTVLEQIVASSAKLATTNKELMAVVKKLTNDNKDLQRETNCLKKRGGSGATQGKRDPTLCPHCKKEVYHEPDACFDLANNKDKQRPGWKI